MLRSMTKDYHHGDLPSALRSAAVDLIAEKGPGGFSLREVARRAGVSHSAPAHHFGDTRGLLTSVATEGFEVLTENLRAAAETEGTTRDRIIAMGNTYLATALANPGHYSVMINHDYTNTDDHDLTVAGIAAYEVLMNLMLNLRDEHNPTLDDLAVEQSATLVWSTVHGLVGLSPVLGHVAESNNTTNSEIEDLIERFADMVIEGVRITNEN